MMRRVLALAILCVGLVGLQSRVIAQEDPAHNELRAMAKDLLGAVTSGDIDKTLTYVHPNVVVTWQNLEVARGHQGLRDFFQRTGKDMFKGYKTPPTPDDLTILYGGDTGVSWGTSVGQYQVAGQSLEFTNRWTATVVKENGRWLLASYHVSNNTMDNPLLNAAVRSLIYVGIAALVVGLLIGWLLGRRRRLA